MLYWNVELYRKLGHMVETTGSRMKGKGTIFHVYRCLKPYENVYHEVQLNVHDTLCQTDSVSRIF